MKEREGGREEEGIIATSFWGGALNITRQPDPQRKTGCNITKHAKTENHKHHNRTFYEVCLCNALHHIMNIYNSLYHIMNILIMRYRG